MIRIGEGSQRLRGKRIALCLTGSIAAIEAVKIARELRRHGADVIAYMTQGATEIIHPNAMEFATGKKPVTKLSGTVEHLSKFDLVVVAPATANTLSKIAHGIADNPVTSLVLASSCSILLAPAMHKEMYEDPLFLRNLEGLKKHYLVADPVMEERASKLAPMDALRDLVFLSLSEKDMRGKKVVVTAGPTTEPIDPVRVLTNRSSGKMGIAIAREAFYRGAEVVLIYGPGCEAVPLHMNTVRVETGEEMADAVRVQQDYDIFIGAAAVSDFMVKAKGEKLDSRQGAITLRLEPAQKILSMIKKGSLIVGFKAAHGVSKEELIELAKTLLDEHGLDLVVANDVSNDVFGSDEAAVLLVSNKWVSRLERMSKNEVARRIFDILVDI